ncbi:MAG: hypothetical protein PVI80_00870 [Anaerolineae bacterium]
MPKPEDEAPAWLHELGATLTEEDQSSGTDSLDDASEIPEWLQDLRASLPEDSEAEMDRTGQEEETPEWLAELRSTAGEAEPETTPLPAEPAAEETEPEAADEEIPEWLARLRPAAEEGEAEAAPPPPVPIPEEAEPEAADEEMPEWLGRLRPAAEEGEAEAVPPPPEATTEEVEPEAADEEMAEWLTRLTPATKGAETEPETTPSPPEPAAEADEVPDWVSELRATAAEEEPELAPADSELEGDELPDWLAEPESVAEEAELESPDLEIEEAEIPDWLAALQPAALAEQPEEGAVDLEAGEEEALPAVEAEIESESFAPEAEEEELPGWLAEFQVEGEGAEPESLPPELEAEAEEMPAEVIETETTIEPPVSEVEAEEQPSEMEEPTTEGPEAKDIALAAAAAAAAAAVVPDLLGTPEEEAAEERPVEGETEVAEAEAAPEAPVPEIEAGEVPDWLAAIEIEVEEETPSGEEMLVEIEGPDWPPSPMPGWEEEDALAPAEIPAWLLALKPTELREEGEAESLDDAFEEPGDTTGLLVGLKGTLPVEMLIAQPRAATEVEAPAAFVSDSPQSRLFAEVVGQPPSAAPKEIAAEPTRVLSMVPSWIIYIVLIVAVTIPLVLGKPLLPHTVEPTRAEEDLYTAIEALAGNAPVLVAFDYDPTSSGEMDVVAQALVGQLMDRGAKVVTMSLLPAGPATAQSLVDQLAAERTDYEDSYGQRYANLGYLPGQAAAVRLVGLSLETAFAHDYYGTPLSELPVMQGLSNSQDFALVVELAAAQDSLRWWVEQAATPYDIPLGAGVSASVGPLARPYYETEQKQLVGMVAGVPGAASYVALGSGGAGLPDALAARLDSLLAGYAILILVLLVGNAVYIARRGAGREE